MGGASARQNHLLHVNEAACLETVEVHPAGEGAGVKRHRFHPRTLTLVQESFHQLAQRIVDLQHNFRRGRESKLNDARRVKRVRIILKERDLLGKRGLISHR